MRPTRRTLPVVVKAARHSYSTSGPASRASAQEIFTGLMHQFGLTADLYPNRTSLSSQPR